MREEGKKRVISAILDILEVKHGASEVLEMEVSETGEKAGIDNMSELISDMLANGHIYRPAIGKLGRRQRNQRAKPVKVEITVERDGKVVTFKRYDEWLDSLTVKGIAEEIDNAIGAIDEA